MQADIEPIVELTKKELQTVRLSGALPMTCLPVM